MTFHRAPYEILKSRIEQEPRRFIQVLYGPRQVGKTTVIRQFLDQTQLPNHYIAADAVAASDDVWISNQWEAARLKLADNREKQAVLVIDEVQKVNSWSEQVKKEWDRDSAQNLSLRDECLFQKIPTGQSPHDRRHRLPLAGVPGYQTTHNLLEHRTAIQPTIIKRRREYRCDC
jgi:hypothetical protein